MDGSETAKNSKVYFLERFPLYGKMLCTSTSSMTERGGSGTESAEVTLGTTKMKGTKVLTVGAGRYLYACDTCVRMRGTIIRC